MAELGAMLTIVSGPLLGKSFALNSDVVLRRAKDCELHVSVVGISRKHLRIVLAKNRWVLIDLGSTNGTYARGERVQVLRLRDGDLFSAGRDTVFKFTALKTNDPFGAPPPGWRRLR